MVLKCLSCGLNLIGQDNFVKFKCPECSDFLIVRCRQCRRLSNKYKCQKCGFEGP